MSKLEALSLPPQSGKLRMGAGSSAALHTAFSERRGAARSREQKTSDTKPEGAFTLMELMAVVAIIAILAALTLGTLGFVNKKGAESRARSEVAALSAAIDAFKLEFGSYPPDEDTLLAELTGSGVTNTGKLLFEPTAGMVNSNTMKFIDPWGSDYEYTTNATYNVGFFDLWSTAGNAAATNAPNWIRN